jgi:succinyl-CoA synthetase alpha subunit
MAPGRIGIVSRSPALVRKVGRQLPMFGLGASKVVCVPAQPRRRMTHLELLKMFDKHWGTDAVLLLGAIDAGEEQACMDWITHMNKPVIGFIDDTDPALAQRERLRACGVHISADAASIGELTASLVELPCLPFD